MRVHHTPESYPGQTSLPSNSGHFHAPSSLILDQPSLTFATLVEHQNRTSTTATVPFTLTRDSSRLFQANDVEAGAPPRVGSSTPNSAVTRKLPTLAFLNTASGQLWPGATVSTGSYLPPSHTLPTPPGSESDVFRPPSEGQDASSINASLSDLKQVEMASGMETAPQASSLTSRRPAASGLVHNLQLPSVPAFQQGKSTEPIPINTSQSSGAALSVGNLLTPPSNIPGDSFSPLSAAVNGNGGAPAQMMPPFTPSGGTWQVASGSGISPFGYGSGNTPGAWSNNMSGGPLYPRNHFSPSFGSNNNNSARNNAQSPTGAEGLPPPPPLSLDSLQQPMPQSISMAAPQPSMQQQAAMVGVPTPVSATTTQASPVNPSDAFVPKNPPTPSYYQAPHSAPTSHQNQYAASYPSLTSPIQNSPSSATMPNRFSPTSQGPNYPVPTLQRPRPLQTPAGQYALPAMTGPMMSNIQTAHGTNVSVMSGGPPGMMPSQGQYGFNSGHSAQMQMSYGGHQQQAVQERPFKCDTCPQSFNRNHDLKRHKRIHLAVKPFPCKHCDKSFSRKDALKV